MYLIPKNIKVKREIFKGFGLLEILIIVISLGIGYLLSLLANDYKLKIVLFSFLPLASILLLIPLPNGTTILKILIKFLRYTKNQKIYKYK